MNPQNPTPAPEDRERVAPPTFSAPALLSPDTTIAPSASDAQSAHGEITAAHVFQPKPEEVVSYNKLNPAGTNSLPQPEPAPVAQPPAVAAADPAAPTASAPTMAGHKRSSVSKRLLAVVAVIVIIVAGVALFSIRNESTQTALAAQFISDIQAGNATNAYGVTSTKFQEATSKDTFESYTVKESQLLPKTKPVIVSTQTDKTSASSISIVTMNIKNDGGGSDYHAVIQMVKEGSDWVVFSADIQSGLYSEPLSTSK